MSGFGVNDSLIELQLTQLSTKSALYFIEYAAVVSLLYNIVLCKFSVT